MRRFAGIELGDNLVPDETTILNFRHLLERHGLTEAIFADVNAHLSDKGITLRSGTLVDATIIEAPSSTKNKAGESRAPVPRPQTPVRPYEDPLPRAGQEPRPTLNPVRARQPVPGPTEADGMRTGLPEICQTAQRRARNNEISCQKPVSRLPSRSSRHLGAAERVDQMFPNCSIPDVSIDERRLPLFIARATLRDLIAGLEARATDGVAR